MRLAALLGLRHDKWVCLACGNAAEVRPKYKTPADIDISGVSELHYFDADGERRKRNVQAEPEPPAPVKKVSRSSPR